MSENPHYDPKMLLDTLREILSMPSDRRLAVRLGGHPPVLSKIRHGHLVPTPELLISMHEETNIGIRGLRALMGDFRAHSGGSASHPTHTELEQMLRKAAGHNGSQKIAAHGRPDFHRSKPSKCAEIIVNL